MMALLLSFLLLLGFAMRVNPEIARGLFGTTCGGTASHARNASTSLKTIAIAQFDFAAADRDWNTVKDYWRKDIAGLYAFYAPADTTKTPIRLIELSTASADDRSVSDLTPYAVKSAKAGYWFRALLHEDEQTPAPDRFAACAYPDTPSADRWTFIIDEENVVYRKQLKNQRGVERYPKDPVAEGWARFD